MCHQPEVDRGGAPFGGDAALDVVVQVSPGIGAGLVAEDGVGNRLEALSGEALVDFGEGGGVLAFFFGPGAHAFEGAVGMPFAAHEFRHERIELGEVVVAFFGVADDRGFDFDDAGDDVEEKLGFDADDLVEVDGLPVDRFPMAGVRLGELLGEVGDVGCEDGGAEVAIDQRIDAASDLQVSGVVGDGASEVEIGGKDGG